MKQALFLILMVIGQVTYAQKISIKGLVADTTGSPLPSATVLLLQAKDSSLVNFSSSNTQGAFELKNIAPGNYLLKITFLGHKPFLDSVVPVNESNVADMGLITLRPLIKELDEVIVKGERDPVTIKKDTIEYNAGSFKTRPNATVEELLKKLPGVEVDNEGNITTQGEQVRRVTVDGKTFFANDPKLATRNLPADAIDKVQVFDKKSDQAEFSGIDDGQREKTINLELKEDKRNGAFGNVHAGAGSNYRFQGRANINRFSKGQQLSILAMSNNVNEQGFSMQDYMNFSGGAQQMGRGGSITISDNNSMGVPLNFGRRQNGLMTTFAGGANFNKELSKKTEANGSYFFNHLGHSLIRNQERENFFPGGTVLSNQNSNQLNSTTSHRANLMLDHKIDSANSLRLTSAFNYTDNEQNVKSNSRTVNTAGEVQNEGERISYNLGTGLNLNTSLLYRHRFAKKGRTFSANNTLDISQNNANGSLDAENRFARGEDQVIRQSNLQNNGFQSVGTTLSYTEPLGNRMYLEGNYNLIQNLNQVNREVYDLTGEDRILNRGLSNRFNSNYQYHKPGVNFRMNRKQYNFMVGSSMQQTRLRGNLANLDAPIDRSFRNFLPTMRANVDFSSTKHLTFNYETSVQEPGIQQLQPVVDNTDPLNIYMGNPALRPAYSHMWRLNYNSFEPTRFISFFSMANVNYTTNAITNSQTITEQLVRITQPVNVRESLNMNGNISFGFPVRKLNSRFNIGTNGRHGRNLALLNEAENTIFSESVNGNLRYEFRYKELAELTLRTEQGLQQTRYAFNSNGMQQDQLFYNQTYAAEVNLHFLKRFNFNSSFDYLIYANTASNFRETIPLWNLTLSGYMLKNNSGELKLSAVNLLDRNVGVNQRADVNYVERETLNNLGRYVMLTFVYTINKHLNPMGARRGGVMRIIN
jgi:hypothetical protein